MASHRRHRDGHVELVSARGTGRSVMVDACDKENMENQAEGRGRSGTAAVKPIGRATSAKALPSSLDPGDVRVAMSPAPSRRTIREASAAASAAEAATAARAQARADTSARYAHILQPIRDLAENWNIDLANELEHYLADLEDIQVSLDGGVSTLNFAEAALLIQGSACVYSKKVEFLYSLVFRVLDLLAKRADRQASSIQEDGRDVDAAQVSSKDEDGTFLLLDDIKENRADSLLLDDSTPLAAISTPSLLHRTPLALIDTSVLTAERGVQDGAASAFASNFRLASGSMHPSGAILLDPAMQDSLHMDADPDSDIDIVAGLGDDDEVSGAADDIGDEMQRLQQPAGQDGVQPTLLFQDAGKHDAGGVGDNDNNNDEQHDSAAQDAMWQQLDAFDTAGAARPFCKATTRHVPHECGPVSLAMVLSLFRHADGAAAAPPRHSQRSLSQPAHAEFQYAWWRLEQKRRHNARSANRDAGRGADVGLRSSNSSTMKPSYQYEARDHGGDGDDDDDDDNDHDHSLQDDLEDDHRDGMIPLPGNTDIPDVKTFDSSDIPELETVLSEHTSRTPGLLRHSTAMPASSPMASEPDAGQMQPDPLVDSTAEYQARCRQRVAEYHALAQRHAQESDMSRRVAAWEDAIAPVLAAEDARPGFDIHQYGADVLQALPADQAPVRFSDVAATKQDFDVCRTFLATLTLANSGNLEIIQGGDEADFSLSLRSRDMASFVLAAQ